MTIVINNVDVRIRPSSVETFFGCSYQWAKTHLEGVNTIPNSRAAIGTAIHAGVEAMWVESISSKKKNPNKSMMTDAAIDKWKEEIHDGVKYGDNENESSCAAEIVKGTEAFIEDIVPFSSIPNSVEAFYKVDIDHPVISEIGGTVDYITDDTIADVKTSKRKSSAEKHTIQQSLYKYLANANGLNIKHNLIQQVVLKKESEGAILKLDADIEQSKYLVNTMLDTLELVSRDLAPVSAILRPNPNYVFCSNKFCAIHDTCPAVKGNLQPDKVIQQVKL